MLKVNSSPHRAVGSKALAQQLVMASITIGAWICIKEFFERLVRHRFIAPLKSNSLIVFHYFEYIRYLQLRLKKCIV